MNDTPLPAPDSDDLDRRNAVLKILGATFGAGAILSACQLETSPGQGPASDVAAGGEDVEHLASALVGTSSVRWCDTTANLKSITGQGTTATTTALVAVLGRSARGDGGGGLFAWIKATPPAADNGGTIFLPTTQPASPNGPGYWQRIFVGALDVRWFGAKGNGAMDDTAALQSAANAVPANGGVLYFPAGAYLISGSAPVQLKNRTVCRGDGPGTVLRRTDATGYASLSAKQTWNVRITSMRFEQAAIFNYMTSVDASGSVACSIDHCEFAVATNDPIPSGSTLHAILATNVAGIRPLGLNITDNRVSQMQIKAAGGTGASQCIIARNHISAPNNFAISFVASNNPVLTDCIIKDNIIVNAMNGGGIFVGGDGDSWPNVTLKQVIVANNIISGNWIGTIVSNMVLVNFGPASSDILISGNLLRNDNAAPVSNSGGILLQMGTGAGNSFDNVTVVDNAVHGVDQYGISLFGTGKNVTISRNKVSGSRGVRVIASAGGIAGVDLTGNKCKDVAGFPGITLDATGGSISAVNATGNQLPNGDAGITRIPGAFTISGLFDRNV